MPFGRLDVFWPDGKFESFLLNSSSVSVGRSSGCTVVLETDTISRYHFSITQQGEAVEIADMDSANGTFVDGLCLDSNESRPLQGGEELQIGHLRMIYHRLDESHTIPITELSEDTQRYVREDYGFHVEVYGPEIAVPPGSHTSIEISIFNNTPEPKPYTVKVEGLPEGWARVNRPQLVVDADDNAPVLVNIKPVRHSSSKPGDYPVKVIVALKNEPEKVIEVGITVTILPYGGFGMALASSQITAYDALKLHVHNQGSTGLPIYVMGRSEDDALQVKIPQPQLTLAPGERHVIQGEVIPRKRRWFGSPKTISFDVMVRSRDEAAFLAAIRGQYVDEPIMPTWAAVGLGAAVSIVVLLLAAAVLLVLFAPAAAPEIINFQASAETVAQGEPVIVSWQVEDADDVTISINSTPAAVAQDARSLQIDTSNQRGQTVIQLEASSSGGTASRALTVNVFVPLSVEYFEVTPQILVRNVVQDINVRWQVNEAEATHVEGLETLGPIAIEPSYGPQGDFDISGIPTDNFAVTLYAEDADGRTLEQVINVDLISPECTTTEALTFYAAPNTSANVVSTLPAQTVIVVDGRDETGAWLRTQLSGGVSAWGARNGLLCVDTFNPDNLRIRIDPSLGITPQPGQPVPSDTTSTPATPDTTDSNTTPSPDLTQEPETTATP